MSRHKPATLWLVALLFFFSLLAPDKFVFAQELSPKQIAQRVYDRDVGQDSQSRMTMELISARGQHRIRELTVLVRDDGPIRKTFMRFTAPADINGTGFLSIEDGQGGTEQFLYLPALNRTRRIATAQKNRSFVNTDFTFEDMERRPVDDAEHAITGTESLGGVDAWILESHPKPTSNSQYGKVRIWVAQDIFVPLKIDFFDKQEQHIKQYRVLQLERIQEIWTETKVVMEDLGTGHRTILEIHSIHYNSGLPESLFTRQNLEAW
ncbi:MAG: outer membrane lipoprotein-sorting protein [Desulfovibrionales bacterium]|nr:MAG: outer membrane lipoprotein-sorting protein [Desulfovibrionales bacterium]